jgi:hypothetical protein
VNQTIYLKVPQGKNIWAGYESCYKPETQVSEPSLISCRFFLVNGFGYAQQHPTEVRARADRMTLDRVKDYPSMWAACRDLAPKLNIGAETLRKWVTLVQADAGERIRPINRGTRGNQTPQGRKP